MKKRQDSRKKKAAETLRRCVRVCVEEIVESTPVDTGEARSNWRVTQAAVNEAQYPPFDPLPRRTDPDKYYERRNAAAAKAVCLASLAAITDDAIVNGVPIFVQNHIWQTHQLNVGKVLSKQQAPFFVEAAVKLSRGQIDGK